MIAEEKKQNPTQALEDISTELKETLRRSGVVVESAALFVEVAPGEFKRLAEQYPVFVNNEGNIETLMRGMVIHIAPTEEI